MTDRFNKNKSLTSDLKHKITVQRSVSTSNDQGGYTVTWSTKINSLSAGIFPIRADRIFEYRSHNVLATHIIKTRGYVDIAEFDRILWGVRIFEVLTVENFQEQNFLLWITCKEIR